MKKRRPVVLIGLDGADFAILDREMARGRLPVLRGLLERGVRAPLRTTTPPLTFPAWTTFATGVNPGRHGIFDFSEKMVGSYAIRFVNASWRRAPAFWRLLSQAGRRVAVLGVPVTYPPEAVNGVMVCGFDAPGVGGGAVDAASVHPPEFLARLLEAAPDYWLGANLQGLGVDYEQLTQRLLKVLDARLEAFLWAYRREPWDCFVGVVGETDAVCHYFWRFYDPASPFFPAAQAHLGEVVAEVYRRTDVFLGKLLEEMPADAVLMLVSDHGMGPAGNLGVRLNAFLAEAGFLHFLPPSPTHRALALARDWGVRLLPPRLKRLIFRHTGLVAALEGKFRFSHLDWRQTRAYSLEPPQFPAIYLNLKGRDPEGIIPPEDYENLAEQVRQALLAWRTPGGRPLVRRVWRKEELYQGPAVERAPDLLLAWESDESGGHPQFLRSTSGSPALETIVDPDETWLVNRSACHRDLGIFVAAGEGVAPSSHLTPLPGLEDIAPTVLLLQALDEAPPMDGRVLANVFPELGGGLRRGEEAPVQATEELSPEDEEEVKARLKALGYL
ncbi:MAG: hypothetical protein FJ128_02285 [Deltaproteobacteria bacterium]|nr:hypothetical protein [Deltaproteobacteria bacterium]